MRRPQGLVCVMLALCLTGCERNAGQPPAQPAAAAPLAAKPSPGAAEALAAVTQRLDACLGNEDLNVTGRQQCHSQAIREADALVARSKGGPDLHALLPDLFEPLLYALTGGEDALAMRMVVMGAYSDFARQRAAILTGVGSTADDRPVAAAFDRLGDVGAGFSQRWAAIRDADCAAYPVTNCAARLDAAMAAMLDDLNPKNTE